MSARHDPKQDRDICLEWVFKYHMYSGWFLLESGHKYKWIEIYPLLKILPETPDPSPYDKSVPGFLYKNE